MSTIYEYKIDSSTFFINAKLIIIFITIIILITWLISYYLDLIKGWELNTIIFIVIIAGISDFINYTLNPKLIKFAKNIIIIYYVAILYTIYIYTNKMMFHFVFAFMYYVFCSFFIIMYIYLMMSKLRTKSPK